MGKWEKLQKLNQRLVKGNLPLGLVTGNFAFRKSLNDWGLEEEKKEELSELITRMASISEVATVSNLRTRLTTDPEMLGLDVESTQALLILFIDRGKAAEYKNNLKQGLLFNGLAI